MTTDIGLTDSGLWRQRALVDGRWIDAADGRTIPVDDPATSDVIGAVPHCGTAETETAIAAAARALPAWRALPAPERCAILQRWHDLMVAATKDLARILTAEQGKPLAEAEGEIAYAASFVQWFVQEGQRSQGHEVPAPTADRRILVRKEPVGVCAAITPWNFPAAMITRKLAPALAAGCTIVLKPSELTPFTALALGELAIRAGVPAGVLGIVTGHAKAIGAALTGSPAVRLLSFTGSTPVGTLLMQQCAPTIKKLALELGGNAPFLVFDDAELDGAVEAAMAAKFRNAGQSCVAANRILVQAGIHDAFVERLAARVRALKVGPGTADGMEIGPLIDDKARAKVAELVADAQAKGATLVAQATAPPRFTAPMLLTGMTQDMRAAQEEIFGPVAAIYRFETEADGIALANATPYGLATYCCTGNMHRAWRVSEALDAGMVGLNTGAISLAMAPFGGVKQSGLGREGGAEGLEEYLETKAVHWAGLQPG
ncbi:succinate-semialdehyde dehydrogenase [Croceibacterium mercuriale]|uniref:Succinate-semialdehyde dehydrogenase n=1 Tax=Croceibacterium mercuriale TaxID=1572751 RepID=A0A0B2BTY3_9SPHN|nr:NAD-dependent succinate-semialdehyde dehydrogenase [Croceibacterium mercuriale]KHL24899.1 succinate-semialdehyde dehydrogenase [Croceibacterium mercuriale]